MAKATVITKYDPRPSVPHIALELTPEEVMALYDALGTVGGEPKTSRRKFINNILNAIRDTRPAAFDNGEVFYFINDRIGSISFI